MATFKAVVSAHQRRADGSYNIKIRVTHRRVSRWLATNLTAYPADLTRTLNIKSKALQWRCDELIRQMREAISDIPPFALEERDVEWVVQRVKAHLAGDEFRLDFFAYARDYIDESKQGNTRCGYLSALRSFTAYLGKDSIDVNEITKAMLQGFMEWVDNSPKRHASGKVVESQTKLPGGGQSTRLVMKLSHIYQKARDRYNDEDAGSFPIPRNPFKGLELSFPAPRTGQKSLGFDLMQRIILAPKDDPERTALDVFVLSFALMGANLADLYEAPPLRCGAWTYERKKTRSRRADGAEMVVDVPLCAMPFVSRLDTGGQWWLGKLHKLSRLPENITACVNRSLHRWQQREGVPPFTFYAARKTWATLARKAGVEKATIDECLCHVGDLRMADIYIEKDYTLLNEANAKVLALFEWPTTEASLPDPGKESL